MEGATLVIPVSPTPLAPNGPVGSGSSTRMTSTSGHVERAQHLVGGEAVADYLAGLPVDHQVFGQSVAKTLGCAPFEAPLHGERVDGPADIVPVSYTHLR